MQIKQLELNLWEAIALATKTPEEADLPMVLDLLDLTLSELAPESQLRLAGDAVGQITDLFCDRSSLLFEVLQARSANSEPVMSSRAFDRYVRQSVVVDFEMFMQPLTALPRKAPEKLRDQESVVSAVDKAILIEVLEQENILSREEEIDFALATAHSENVSAWIAAIADCLASNTLPMRLLDLYNCLNLPMVEVWLGLLLGNFHLLQKGNFYDSHEIWINLNSSRLDEL